MSASVARGGARRIAARGSARRAANSRWIEVAGRVGHVAKGVSYVLVGALALQVAFGQRNQTEDRQGILREVASEPFGTMALWLLAIGFACYALWRFVQAAVDPDGHGTDGKGLARRAESAVLGVIYTVSAVAAVSLAVGSGSSTGNEREETARVLDWPAGQWIVGFVGVGLMAYGAWNVVKGQSQKFREQLREHEMQPGVRPWAIRTGVVGHIARGVVFVMVGFFLTKAAVEYDPDEAVGIDGALAKLARQSYGTWLLAAVAAGLVAYGVYSFVQARYRRF